MVLCSFMSLSGHIRTGSKKGNEGVSQIYIPNQSKSAEYKQLHLSNSGCFSTDTARPIVGRFISE